MATITDATISTLNELIETCKDGENGFREAAEGVDDPQLKSLFLDYSNQRAMFASDLQTEVRRLGGDAETTGSTAASIHRGWIDIKSAVMGQDRKAILNECERGEDSAKKAYENALKEDLTADVRQMVAEQHTKVVQAHDRIRDLRDACGC